MSAEITKLYERVANNEADIENLIRWEKTQNGSLAKIDEKVTALHNKFDDLKTWMLNTLIKALIVFFTFTLGLVAWLIQRG